VEAVGVAPAITGAQGRVPDLLKPRSVSLLEKHSLSKWVAVVRVVNITLIMLVEVEVEDIPEFSVPAQH
jgi:hypothetical protein